MALTTRYVPGEGPQSAAIWFIGEAPGRDENASGRPFDGAAGRMLDQGLRAVGIVRAQCRVDNCFKKRPPNNEISYYFRDDALRYPTEEGQVFIQELQRDLELYRPNLVVALGAIPLRILTGKRRITKWRGSVLPCTLVEGIKVYPTFHPSYVMRMMQEKGEDKKEKQAKNAYPVFIKDLSRALEQSKFSDIRLPQRKFLFDLPVAEVIEWIANIPSGAVVAVDIETIIGANTITRMGLAHTAEEALSIPFIKSMTPCVTSNEFAALLISLDALFRREDVKKLFHNGLFDMLYLAKFWHLLCAPGTVEDTMILHHATYPHLPKALAELTSYYTWEPYYKDDGKQFGTRVGDAALSIYNSRDCCVTREIYDVILQDAKEIGTYTGYRRTLSYLPSLMAMSLRGVKFNKDLQGRLTFQFQKRCEEIDIEISSIMGRSYHISSAYTADLVKLLYEDRRYPIQMKNGKATTDADAIRKIGKKYPNDPIPRLVVEKKKLLKLISTYTEMVIHADGRVRTTYDPTGTTTWRLSSRESNFGGGGNLQNIPKHPDAFTGLDVGKEIRKLFIPDEGMVMVAADLKQAEAMIVAWLSQEEIEIEAFEKGDDIHWINTKAILGLPPGLIYDSKDKDHKNKRNMGKTIKHASNYDMGPLKLQSELLKFGFVLEVGECQSCLQRVRDSRPMIQLWKASIRNQIDSTRTLITPLGRKRVFYGRKSDDLYRKAYAFIPQSTVGEIACLAIRDIHADLEVERGICEILLNVHDEVVVQCKPSLVTEVMQGIKKHMERPLVLHSRPLTIPCDFKIGNNWGEMKETVLEPFNK